MAAGRIIYCKSLITAPSEILSAGAGDRLKIDLLPQVLAYIADPEITGNAVEAEPPRVPDAQCPDLRPGIRIPYEWIARWYGIRCPAIHIDPKDLSKQLERILCPVAGVSCRSAIAHPDIEVAIRTEIQIT